MKKRFFYIILLLISLILFLNVKPVSFEKVVSDKEPTYVYADNINIIKGQDPYKLKETSSKREKLLWDNFYEQFLNYKYLKSSNTSLSNNQIEIYVTYGEELVKIVVDEKNRIVVDDGNREKEYVTFGKKRNLYQDLLKFI